MTIAEISAQMGVAPETLVQEVVAQGTARQLCLSCLARL